MKTTRIFALFMFLTAIAFAQKSPLNVEKGKLLYENSFASEEGMRGWKMEGSGVVEFIDNWMNMYSPNEESHHVYWCPDDFPADFIAEWELQNMEPDAGLCIVFFSAKGVNGEDIFDPSLKPRDGVFKKYTKGDLNNYHISYYANGKDNPGREISHIRKNKGFHLVKQGEPGIPVKSTEIHKVTLIKKGNNIKMYVDGRNIIDWTDDGVEYGPVLGEGKIGLRQMQWTHFRYRDFKVWSIVD